MAKKTAKKTAKKPKQPRRGDGKFGSPRNARDWSEKVAEWFRKENDRTQTEGVREWETSKESGSKSK